MLDKILRSRNGSRFPPRDPPRPVQAEQNSAALRIVHAGGIVECYFMAIPAKRILDKYPSCYLTRPDVFRRPWDSVVRPDEILTPGEKFFVVPRRTVWKLHMRIEKGVTFVPHSICDVPGESRDEMSSSGTGTMSGGTRKNVVEEQKARGFKVVPLRGENWQVRRGGIWQPSLAAIMELHGM